MRVEWLAAARDDLNKIFDYLLERNPYAAEDLAEALILVADSLKTFPYRGRMGIATGTRELLAVRPYLVIYEVDETRRLVIIQKIWHGAQDRP